MLDKNKAPVPRKSIRKPGRPTIRPDAPGNDMKKKIMDVAETLFGERGWSATSFRDIANEAQVNPAMITYYFGTKKGLIEMVFKRRGMEIAENWTKRLEALQAESNGNPSVYDLLHAYLSVAFHTKKEGASGLAFVKLQARVHNETDEFFFRLRREVYDEATKKYIAALEQALPHVDPADINWRMIFVISTYLYMLAGVDRLNDLSSGRFNADDIDEATLRAAKFMVGGMSAESTFEKAPAKKSAKPKRSKKSV